MSIVTIIRLLLGITNMLMRRASDRQQQTIGADRVIKSNLVNILVSVRTSKRIDAASKQYTDEDVDRILKGKFRD